LQPPNLSTERKKTDIPTLLSADILALRLPKIFVDPLMGLRWCDGWRRYHLEDLMSTPSKRKSTARPKGRKANPHQSSRSSVASGTKHSKIIALLNAPSGATIAAMMKMTGWQQHSVRGFLAGVVRKKLKLDLVSEVGESGRIYRIVNRAAGKKAS
jgi:hypothetical protein